MVSFLIISMMVPTVMALVGTVQDGMELSELTEAAERLGDSIDRVGSRGQGYSAHVDISIPNTGYLEVGGDEGYVIRIFQGDSQAGRVLLRHPVCGADAVLFGDVILEMSNDPDGNGVVVREL